MEHELFICACYSLEHQMILSYFDDEPDVYMSVHLCRLPFFKRLWAAICYVFGKRSAFGAFEEIVLREEDVKRLNDVLSQRIKYSKKITG